MYNNDILSRVRVTGFVNEDVLYGLNIHWSDLFVTVMPPKRILEEMGTPTNVFVGLGSGRNYISAKLWLEYPELNTYFVYSTAVFFEAPHILCLNPQEWIDEDLEVGLNAIIFSPEADALQLFLLRRSKTGFDIGSLEQATRYTPETFTEYVLTEEDSCIEVDSDSLVFYE
jgi:hypothetical protein